MEEGRDGQVVVQDPSDVGGRDEAADDPPETWREFSLMLLVSLHYDAFILYSPFLLLQFSE